MKLQKSKAGHILSGTAERDTGRNVYAFYIGIDPDVTASGFAVWLKREKRFINIETKSFFSLFDALKGFSIITLKDSTIVHIEGAWLKEKSNWHPDKQHKKIGERIAKNVGSNHQIGKLLVEACQILDLSFVVREPSKPIFNDENYFKRVTKWKHRTNKDSRSAANYVFGF